MKKELEIQYTEDIGSTPAAVDRFAGVLYINPSIFPKLTDFQKKFIIAHEEGHYYLDTSDEFKADEYAFNKLAGTEFQSLKQAVNCLPQVLDVKNITLKPRFVALYKLACKWDYIKNNNQKALEQLEWLQKYGDLDFWKFGLLQIDSDSDGDTYYKQQQANALFLQQIQTEKVTEQESKKSGYTMLIFVAIVFALGFIFYKKL